MSLAVSEVRSPADLRDFIGLPRLIYRGMPGFVPPLDHERGMLLHPAKAAFFSHGEATYWLARRNGQLVGRISAQIDRLATAPECAQAGFFGCLDAVDQLEVVRALTATAENWIAARQRVVAQGPYLLSINGESGVLVDGYTTPPMFMMPWHPPYLAGLLAAAGYRRVQTLLAFSLGRAGLDEAAWQRAAGRRRRSAQLRLRGLRLRALAAEGQIIKQLFNDAWSSNWGFVPLAVADVEAIRTGFRTLANADAGVFAEWQGETVGFMLLVPNIFDITADLGGAPGLFGWMRFVFRLLRKRFDTARFILMGISAKHRATPLGAEITIAMISEMIRRIARSRLSTIEAGWILHDNTAMIRIVQALGFRQCRAYGIFEKPLNAAAGLSAQESV